MTQKIADFRKTALVFYEQHGRKTLPWRLNTGAWPVLVSEYMLQQTQVDRVIGYWERWLTRWPSPEALAAAPLAQALAEWNGLGYNRRGRFLWECARKITADYGGEVPRTVDALRTLPGTGPYTSGAIASFAYNIPAVFIETNIRTALIHFFFDDGSIVNDAELLPLLEAALEGEDQPRLWYWALMDWGAALKKAYPNPSRRSAAYTRQSRFEGSFRQKRGALLRALLTQGAADMPSLEKLPELAGMASDAGSLYDALRALEKDGFIIQESGVYRVRE
jgi:A/G-specific adenine glycosylase